MRGAKQKKMLEMSGLRRKEILHLRFVCLFVPKAEGGTLIFSCMRELFLGFKILNFNIFGGFQKPEWDMKIFWGHHKIGLYLQVIRMHFRVFSEGQGTDYRMEDIFLGC